MSLVCSGCKKNLGNSRRAYAGHIYRCDAFLDFQRQTLNAAALTGISEEPPSPSHDAHGAEEIHDEPMSVIPQEEVSNPSESWEVRTSTGLTILIPPVRNYVSVCLFLS